MNSSTNSTGMSYGMDPAEAAHLLKVWIWACVAFPIVATVAVAIRFLARWRTVGRWGNDDFLIAFSVFPLWALVGVGIDMANNGGMGLPAAFLSSNQSYVFYRTLFASMMLYPLCITTVKMSILIMYARVFDIRRFRIVVYIVGTLCLFWFVIVVLVTFFLCQPVAFAWDRTKQGHCDNLRAMYYGITISNMILDLVINFMPFHMVWKIQVSRKQRLIILFFLLLGLISDFAAAGRIYAVPHLAVDDVSSSIMMPLLYTVIEPAFAIICACLVTYRPLLVIFSPKSLRHFFTATRNRFRTTSMQTPLNNPSNTASTANTNPFGSSASSRTNPFASTNHINDTDLEHGGFEQDDIELRGMESQESYETRINKETEAAFEASMRGANGSAGMGARRGGGGPGPFGRGRGGAYGDMNV